MALDFTDIDNSMIEAETATLPLNERSLKMGERHILSKRITAELTDAATSGDLIRVAQVVNKLQQMLLLGKLR